VSNPGHLRGRQRRKPLSYPLRLANIHSRYSISTDAPLEIIQVGTTGVVYAPSDAFDFENKPTHTVRITASDSKEDPALSLVTTKSVTIEVVDVNDESPRLTPSSSSAQVLLQNLRRDSPTEVVGIC
jgi:hypothetical protein